jgi:Protein of unknown function (DUF3892)
LLFITAVRLEPTGESTEHISNVWWLKSDDGTAGMCSLPALIRSDGMEAHGAFVAGSQGPTEVEVVRPDGGDPYIRTVRDSTLKDNLLSLPRF